MSSRNSPHIQIHGVWFWSMPTDWKKRGGQWLRSDMMWCGSTRICTNSGLCSLSWIFWRWARTNEVSIWLRLYQWAEYLPPLCDEQMRIMEAAAAAEESWSRVLFFDVFCFNLLCRKNWNPAVKERNDAWRPARHSLDEKCLAQFGYRWKHVWVNSISNCFWVN